MILKYSSRAACLIFNPTPKQVIYARPFSLGLYSICLVVADQHIGRNVFKRFESRAFSRFQYNAKSFPFFFANLHHN